jgi:hypothetical protein
MVAHKKIHRKLAGLFPLIFSISQLPSASCRDVTQNLNFLPKRKPKNKHRNRLASFDSGCPLRRASRSLGTRGRPVTGYSTVMRCDALKLPAARSNVCRNVLCVESYVSRLLISRSYQPPHASCVAASADYPRRLEIKPLPADSSSAVNRLKLQTRRAALIGSLKSKHDGYRLIGRRDVLTVRLYNRNA